MKGYNINDVCTLKFAEPLLILAKGNGGTQNFDSKKKQRAFDNGLRGGSWRH